ncbi:hypothetical protein E4T56_gene18245 [Termitomyces sp. T112]|nr:hypothetical protein E4T56_gene18245 [Termitomyces sp. T112]
MVASQVLHSAAPFLTIITRNSSNRSDFSTIPQLSPAILPRNYPIWCTERPLLRQTRALEWKACIWQLWLDSFGDYAIINTVQGSIISVNHGVTDDHFSSRFKGETCDFMAKTLAILGPKKRQDGKEKLEWLKEACDFIR